MKTTVQLFNDSIGYSTRKKIHKNIKIQKLDKIKIKNHTPFPDRNKKTYSIGQKDYSKQLF